MSSPRSHRPTTPTWGPLATQWFIVSDLGLTTLSGHDGVHVIVRSLSTAEPVAGVKLQLIAVNNEILGEAVTDDAGYARFDPGLARGTGGMAPHSSLPRPTATIPSSTYARRLRPDRPRRRGTAGAAALDVFLTPSAASTGRARPST